MQRTWYGVVCGVCVALFAVGFFMRHESASITQAPVNSGLPMQTVIIGTTTIQAEVASTDAERELGLSNRTSLAQDHGMLFVFEPPRVVNFWMKDMHFALDMIFATHDGTIVNIAHDATPESYFNEQPPRLFSSGAPITYVLEVPAGYADAHDIAIGQKIVVQ